MIVATIVTAAIVAYVAINIFVIGGENFVLTLTSYASPIFSMIAAALAIRTWSDIHAKDVSKSVWAGIAAGLGLWAIGDVASASATMIYGDNVPQITISDIFWLAAYVALSIALLLRSRSLGITPGKRQMLSSFGVIVALLILSVYFVIWPLIKNAANHDVAASLVNVLYPIGDVLVMMLSIFIIIRLGEGSLAAVWQVLALGLALRSFGDLMYNFATANGLYWPDDHLTLVSILSDIPYVTSYLAISLGIYMQRIVHSPATLEPVSRFESSELSQKTGNADVLIYTNALGKVAFVSNNFLKLVKAQDKSRFANVPLKNVLGLDAGTESTLLYEVSRWGYIRNRPLRIVDQNGQATHVMMTAAASKNESGFSGADIVLRTVLDEEFPDEETISLAKQIYNRAGVRQTENLQVLKAYFEARAWMLYSLILRLGGENIARTMVKTFNQTAQENNWHIKMDGQEVIFLESELDEDMAKALPTLMRLITQSAKNVAGYQIVEEEIRLLESNIETGNLNLLDNFGVR
jgi:hypothetical protein